MKYIHSLILVLTIAYCFGQDYQITKFDIPELSDTITTSQLLENIDGSIWLFTTSENNDDVIMRLSNDNWDQINGPCSRCYRDAFISQEGTIYLAAGTDGLFKYENEIWTQLLEDDTWNVFVDAEGQLVIMTDVGIGKVINNQFIETNNHGKPTISSSNIRDKVIMPDNKIYFMYGGRQSYCYEKGWIGLTPDRITLGGIFGEGSIEKDTNDVLVFVRLYTLWNDGSVLTFNYDNVANINYQVGYAGLNRLIVDKDNVFWTTSSTFSQERTLRRDDHNSSPTQEWQISELFTGSSFVRLLFTDSNANCWMLNHEPREIVVLHQSELDLVHNAEETSIFTGMEESCLDSLRLDIDGDGYTGAVDCNDTEYWINPGVDEYNYDGIDNDCNPATLDDDLDQDGFVLADDCDDMNPDINPSAVDIPNNGIDENCDGVDSVTLLAFPIIGWKQGSERIVPSGGQIFHSKIVINRAVRDTLIKDTLYTIITDESDPEILKYLVRYDNGKVFSRNDLVSKEYLWFDFSARVGDTIKIDQTVGFAGKYIVDNIEPYQLVNGQFVKKLDVRNGSNEYSWIEGVGFHSMGLIPFNSFEGGGQSHICTSMNGEVIFDETVVELYDCDFIDLAYNQDLDGDGVVLALDCDDNNPNINPNQEEEPYNGLDDDCRSWTLDDDIDQDGFVLADDCDDNDSQINPNAEEIPNNEIDEDCDGVDLTSSIHELSNVKINIYPNPFFDMIFINVEGELEFESNLLDLKGRVISSTVNYSSIDVNTIPSGLYFLEIQDLKTGNKVVEKLIKK